ncbi:MAG TPA: FAD-binding oxidoreductase [Solirubrobacterales bacterium]|nr:FAD-binding oxidoreductase [Solirubrobacterales bacterium]
MGDFSGLSIRGDVVTADDAHWDQVRQPWNLAADQRPSAVALVEGPDDVAKVVGFAHDNGLRVAAQGTGHGAVALGSLDDVILIKTDRMRGVEVEDGRARVEAGAWASDLGEAAAKTGQAFLPGTSPNVGVTGYTLGGGLSWLGRKYGWACNRVTAIELVTADGEARTVDAATDADLFWALRGGGGGYAVVTALHVELVPVSEAYAGALLFSPELTEEGIRAYRDWTMDAPEEAGSMVRMLNLPPIPDVPEPLRGKRWLAVSAACIGSREEGEQAIAPLREIGEPAVDTFDQIPAPGLTRIAMDPEPPVPGLGHHGLLTVLPDDAIASFVDAAGPESNSPLLLAELRHLGGALRRPPEDHGALDKLDAEFVMLGIGMLMDPALREPITSALDRLADAVDPWAAEGGYFNYAERPCDVEAILPAETCERLAQVKRSWDPDDRILANHSLAAATA